MKPFAKQRARAMTGLGFADDTIDGAFTLYSLNHAICASMTDQSGQTAVWSKLLKSSESPLSFFRSRTPAPLHVRQYVRRQHQSTYFTSGA